MDQHLALEGTVQDPGRTQRSRLNHLKTRVFVDDEDDLAVLRLALEPLLECDGATAVGEIDVEEEMRRRFRIADPVEVETLRLEDPGQLPLDRRRLGRHVADNAKLLHGGGAEASWLINFGGYTASGLFSRKQDDSKFRQCTCVDTLESTATDAISVHLRCRPYRA